MPIHTGRVYRHTRTPRTLTVILVQSRT